MKNSFLDIMLALYLDVPFVKSLNTGNEDIEILIRVVDIHGLICNGGILAVYDCENPITPFKEIPNIFRKIELEKIASWFNEANKILLDERSCIVSEETWNNQEKISELDGILDAYNSFGVEIKLLNIALEHLGIFSNLRGVLSRFVSHL